MSTPPEALRLAAEIEDAGKPAFLAEAAAAELRRLHKKCEALTADTIEEMGRIVEIRRLLAQRDALLEALRPFAAADLTSPTVRDTFGFDVLYARAAIAAVEGEMK